MPRAPLIATAHVLLAFQHPEEHKDAQEEPKAAQVESGVAVGSLLERSWEFLAALWAFWDVFGGVYLIFS